MGWIKGRKKVNKGIKMCYIHMPVLHDGDYGYKYILIKIKNKKSALKELI